MQRWLGEINTLICDVRLWIEWGGLKWRRPRQNDYDDNIVHRLLAQIETRGACVCVCVLCYAANWRTRPESGRAAKDTASYIIEIASRCVDSSNLQDMFLLVYDNY